MPAPSPRLRAFTLIEMLVVMAVIGLLAAIILNLNGLVQAKAARTRALGEIHSLGMGCDSYKADNGSYPQDASKTDALDPRTQGDPKDYKDASLYLYKQLSGDLNANGRNEPNATPAEPKGYLSDYFTPQRLGVSSTGAVGSANYVLFLKDPYGNSYGYSTMGALNEQTYRAKVVTDPTATRTTGKGFNPSYDLWSTGGKTATPGASATGDSMNSWIKNW